MRIRLGVWLACAACLAGCATRAGVTRMVAGHQVAGRFVADEAYAAYLKGVVLETRGQRDLALAAYSEAIRHDPESAELWTRVGALRCADAARTQDDPWSAFSRASEIDPGYEETWTERARCHLKRGELAAAAQAAETAVSLDPERVEPAVLLATVLERQGSLDQARRWLDGLVARDPESVAAREAMIAFAGRTHDEPRRLASEAVLSTLERRGEIRSRVRASLAEVDAAIASGDFERARRLALSARVSSGALAARAAAIGAARFARAQAELVLAADPQDADARAAAIAAADLMRDDGALSRAVTAPSPSGALSPVSALIMAEVLRRRVGASAAEAWLRATGPLTTAGDPLATTLSDRLKRAP